MKIITDVLNALEYLHSLRIMHGDVKTENLLLKNESPDSGIVLTDFGFSRRLKDAENDKSFRRICGTPGYMAPEILLKKGYGRPVDIWALGAITYLLLIHLANL